MVGRQPLLFLTLVTNSPKAVPLFVPKEGPTRPLVGWEVWGWDLAVLSPRSDAAARVHSGQHA